MRRRDKSSRFAHRVCFLSLSLRRPSVCNASRAPSSSLYLGERRGKLTRDGGAAAPPMLCKSSSVCMASLFRLVPLRVSWRFLCISLLSSTSARLPFAPFPPSMQSSAVVTSFVREEANVIYEQSRRPRRHPNRRPRRSSLARRGLRRIPIAIPSVPIKLLFSAGALGMRR